MTETTELEELREVYKKDVELAKEAVYIDIHGTHLWTPQLQRSLDIKKELLYFVETQIEAKNKHQFVFPFYRRYL